MSALAALKSDEISFYLILMKSSASHQWRSLRCNHLPVVCCRTGHWRDLQSLRQPGSHSETTLLSEPRWEWRGGGGKKWTFNLVSDYVMRSLRGKCWRRRVVKGRSWSFLAVVRNHSTVSLPLFFSHYKCHLICYSDYIWYCTPTTHTNTLYTCDCPSTRHPFDTVDAEGKPTE